MKDHESELPRFTRLVAFEPHRTSFECKHEASLNPPISQEADALFQQALALTSHELWPKQRQYAKAAVLYEQAMKMGHWKAQLNLAGSYLQGVGVEQNIEKAIQLTEDLMRKGVPAAWDNMGAYYMGGIGDLKQDATVAYAFWQKAADMGSKSAQAYLGKKLMAIDDRPPDVWGNWPVGMKMLECSFAQGSADAAFALGGWLNGKDKSLNEDYERALKVLHEGVKLGSEKSAGYLSASFRQGDPLVGPVADVARADRYHILADALFYNRDLRFPNLDKVLPLPPAELPLWDGKKETLIEAAKAVVPKPAAPASAPAASAPVRTGRAHIPEGWTLPEKPQVPVPAQYETTKAPVGGYWLAQLLHPHTQRQAEWNAAQLPMRYAEGELFDRSRPGLTREDGRILFHFVGDPVPLPPPVAQATEHPRVAQGVARYADLPDFPLACRGDSRCPQAGIWSARVPDDHPLAALFNHEWRQSYVEQWQSFPDPKDQHLAISPKDLLWTWLGSANDKPSPHVAYISLRSAGRDGVQAGPSTGSEAGKEDQA